MSRPDESRARCVAYMSSPIGDLPIDSTGMRKAVDEIARLTELHKREIIITGEYAQRVLDLQAEIARLTEAQRWIPVSERLPEERGHYLCAVKRTASEEFGGNDIFIRKTRWMGDDWRYAYHIPEWINKEITDTVTHWMPLPEPPKGE